MLLLTRLCSSSDKNNDEEENVVMAEPRPKRPKTVTSIITEAVTTTTTIKSIPSSTQVQTSENDSSNLYSAIFFHSCTDKNSDCLQSENCDDAFSFPLTSASSSPTIPTTTVETVEVKKFISSQIKLELNDLLHNGHFSTIWQTGSNKKIVKLFKKYEFFDNSLKVYLQITQKSHKSFLKFYKHFHCNASTKTTITRPEMGLVLENASEGTLYEYLTRTTLTWTVLSRMIDELVRGVAFLHSEHPSIVHFSLNDTSILISGGLHLKICDFSQALIFHNDCSSMNQACEPRPSYNLHQLLSSDSSRLFSYLAPELFNLKQNDETINNNNNENHSNNNNNKEYSVNSGLITESTAKHADIYSLALLLWQLASRCSDLYQGIPVPEHRRPYELELGTLPGREQIRVLVSKHRARPLFPDIWKNSNPALKLLKETISEAWDPEPEARLTALCMAERVRELPYLWSKHRNDIMISCGLADSDFRDHSQKYTSVCERKEIRYIVNEFQKVKPEHSHKENNKCRQIIDKENQRNVYTQNKNSIEKNMNWATVNKVPLTTSPKITLPLQPHQSRNLCIERNLMRKDTQQHAQEVKLLYQGEKFQYEKRSNSNAHSQYKILNTTGATDMPIMGSDSHSQDRNLFINSSTAAPSSSSSSSLSPLSSSTSGEIHFNHTPSGTGSFAVAPIQLNVQNRIDDPTLERNSSRTVIKNCNLERELDYRNSLNSSATASLSSSISSPSRQKSSGKNIFTLLRSRILAISTLNMIKSAKISSNDLETVNNNNNNNNNVSIRSIQQKLLHFDTDSMNVNSAIVL